MAQFCEIWPYSGFDDQTPTGGPGIVIPYKGVNTVKLYDGKNLKLRHSTVPALGLDEIKDQNYLQALVGMVTPCGNDLVQMLMAVQSKECREGTLRVFSILGHAFVRLGSAKIEAVNPRTNIVEATLKVIVLKKKLLKIAIRPVQVRHANGQVVNSSAIAIDPLLLVNHMNLIWNGQANVFFELSKTDPVVIDGLRPNQPAEINELRAAFIANRDPGADLTFFMVKLALNNGGAVHGQCNAEAGYAVISDGQLDKDNTMAHEAGHYLGSLNENGKFSERYGHESSGSNLLMADGGIGFKIPFSAVTDFNKGYRI